MVQHEEGTLHAKVMRLNQEKMTFLAQNVPNTVLSAACLKSQEAQDTLIFKLYVIQLFK